MHSIVCLLVYVHDIFICGSDDNEVKTLINLLHHKFSMKYLGPLSYFLGKEVSHLVNDNLILTQAKYIIQLLVWANMEHSDRIAIPIWTSYTLSVYIGDVFEHPTLYMNLFGGLQ